MPSPIAGRRVLVVHAASDDRELLVHALANAGAIVRSAESGTDGLAIVLVERVEAIVCEGDAENGRHWIQTVRALADPAKRAVPTLAITRSDAAPELASGRTFDDRVVRPVSARELVLRLTAMLTPAVTRPLPRIF